jgi:hypothetical protein
MTNKNDLEEYNKLHKRYLEATLSTGMKEGIDFATDQRQKVLIKTGLKKNSELKINS